jgi:signal transduction histidine kinase
MMTIGALQMTAAGAEADAAAPTPAMCRLEEALGTAAHELKTPLTSGTLAVHLATHHLDALVAAMLERGDELAARFARVRDLLAEAAGSLGRLDRLVGDLVDVSRVRAGTLALRLAPCDLAAVASEAVEEQRRIAPGRAIRLHVPARSVAPVVADADRIRQVVTNYLTNALRYAPADRPVDVSIRRRGRWVEVAVRDEGPGVPRHERRCIWERFHRADGVGVATGDDAERAPERAQGPGLGLGLGLGLHICKTIVERHQGRVGLRSAPGGGATFWFALPVAGAGGFAQPCPAGARLTADAAGEASDGIAA